MFGIDVGIFFNCSDSTCGGRTIYSDGFFYSDKFDWTKYSSQRNVSGIFKNQSSVEFEIKNIFFNLVSLKELLRFNVSCKHAIFGSLSFTFIENFLRITIYSMKILFQNCISRYKLLQIGVPNTCEAVKKTSSGLGKFTIKKFEFWLRAVFLENFTSFFMLWDH